MDQYSGVMKRIAMAALVVSSMLCLATAHAAAPFADVAETDVYADALSYLKEKGVIQGYEDGTFQPHRTMNRAEALKMLYVGVGEQVTPDLDGASFPDVPKDAWFAHYVAHAQSQGVVKGYPDGTFKPGNTINKAEALKILLSIAREETEEVAPAAIDAFSKGQQLWYAPFLLHSFDLGLTDALNPEDYLLSGNVTRGELAEMLYRLLYIREKDLEVYPVYATGRVSYYSDALIGNKTSSGEVYDPQIFSTAHREAPFRSFIQVIDDATKKSLLVRVNDRGPHTQGGIADLSSVAFGVFYKSSKGVFDGTVYKLPATIQAPAKRYVTTDLLGSVPAGDLPNIFWQDEIFVLEAGDDLPNLTLISPSRKSEVIEASNGGYQLSFAETGAYTLERPGTTKKVTLTVLPRFQGKKVATTKPTAASFALEQGTIPALTWSVAMPETMLRITLSQGEKQKTLYVNAGSLQRVRLVGPLLAGIDLSKALTVTIEAATTSTRFSHDVYSDWLRVGVVLVDGGTQSATPIEPETVSNAFTQEQKDILARVNEERGKKGVRPLTLDITLTKMAQFKSEDMGNNNYFSHPNLQGQDVNDWKSQFGFLPMVAENIAYSTKGTMDNVENLIKSPGHYANMVDSRYEIFGVGVYLKNGKYYMTQLFSTKPLTSSELDSQNAVFQKLVQDAGITTPYDAPVASVAQRWASYISQEQVMSFAIEGKDVGQVLREEVGNYSYGFSVYGDVGLESLKKNLTERLKESPGAKGYGFGLAQDKDGMIRLTVVVKK